MIELELLSSCCEKLDEVIYSKGNIQRQAEDVLQRHVEHLWSVGKLPMKIKKKWLVGFDASCSFFSRSASGIYVGPAKPSRFRARYLKVKALDKLH